MKSKLLTGMALAVAVSAFALTGCSGSGKRVCNQGMEFYNEGEYAKAADYFGQAVDKEPENAEYYVYMGMAQEECGNYEDAIASFRKAAEIKEGYRDAYRGIGIAYFRQGCYEEAAAELVKAVQTDGKYDDISLDAIKYYAACLYNTGKYREAIAQYSILTDKLSKDELADIYYYRGTAYIMLKDENNAVIDYEEAIRLNDDDYDRYCSMYANFMAAGYTERAQSYLKRLLNADDMDGMLAGKTYFNLGDYAKAEEFLRKEYNGGNNEAAYYLAMTYEALEDYASAEQFYDEYLGKNPNDALIYNQYAAYLINRGKYDNALAYIETGISLNNSEVMRELLYNQAVCYEYISDYSKALELFNEYLKKYPNDADALKEQKFLQTRQ
ncbi:MAG: tetratricopeptide repeat protein [Butyrivibrio sp.]